MRYEARTRMSPEQAIALAEKHFAAGSAGLKITSKGEGSICLDGVEGYVTVTACRSGKKTTLDIETSQYDNSVKDFMNLL